MNNKKLLDLIYRLPQLENNFSFGKDIDDIHQIIFNEKK